VDATPDRLATRGTLRVAGVPLRVRPSAIATVVALFLLLLSDLVGGDTPTRVAVAAAAVTAVAFLLSILLHELAHAVVARGLGYEVESVTIFYLGGVTSIRGETEDPGDELATALSGPLVNLLLAGVLAVVARGLAGPAGVVVVFLAELNAAIGVFNLLPAAPLDGGALLRAGLTVLTGDRLRAIRLAARAGQGLGGLLVLTGVGFGLRESEASGFGLLWLAVIGMFILGSARAGLVQADVRQRLTGLSVGELARPLAWVGRSDWTVSMVVTRVARTQGTGVIVDDADRPVGIFSPDQLAAVPTNLWEHLTLSETMSGVLGAVDGATPVLTVLPRFADDEHGVLTVTRYGMPVGLLSGDAIVARVHGRGSRPAPR
jgi:Zn-dependent protease